MSCRRAASARQYAKTAVVFLSGRRRNCRWEQRRVIIYVRPGRISRGAVTPFGRPTGRTVASFVARHTHDRLRAEPVQSAATLMPSRSLRHGTTRDAVGPTVKKRGGPPRLKKRGGRSRLDSHDSRRGSVGAESTREARSGGRRSARVVYLLQDSRRGASVGREHAPRSESGDARAVGRSSNRSCGGRESRELAGQ